MTDKQTVVGVFRDDDTAKAALRRMDEAGFSAGDVGIVADNVRQAREPAGSSSRPSAVIGGVLGAALALLFVAMGGSVMLANPVAIALGLIGFVVAGVAIGALRDAHAGSRRTSTRSSSTRSSAATRS